MVSLVRRKYAGVRSSEVYSVSGVDTTYHGEKEGGRVVTNRCTWTRTSCPHCQSSRNCVRHEETTSKVRQPFRKHVYKIEVQKEMGVGKLDETPGRRATAVPGRR